MLIPFPDSDTGPIINLDSIPQELKLSPMTILEPSESNELNDVSTKALVEETHFKDTDSMVHPSQKKNDIPMINNSYWNTLENLVKKAHKNENMSMATKSGERLKIKAESNPGLHDDRVTMIYDSN